MFARSTKIRVLTALAVCLGGASAASAQFEEKGDTTMGAPEGEATMEGGMEADPMGEPMQDPMAEPAPMDTTEGDADVMVEQPRGHVWADFGITVGEDPPWAEIDYAFSVIFGGSFRVLEMVEAELKLPLLLSSAAPVTSLGAADSETAFGMANPWLGAHYVGEAGGLDYRVGLGITLPVANIDFANPDDNEVAFFTGYYLGATQRGKWDLWLWAPDHMAVTIPATVSMELQPGLTVGADAGFGFLFYTGEADDVDPTVIGQLAAVLGYSVSDMVELGLRLQGVAELADADEDDDDFLLSIEPRVTADFDPAYVTAAVMLNLDEPDGIFGGSDDFEGTSWGIRLGGGTHF